METIRNYVEAMFASLPQTADIISMKEEMLVNLEEKFYAMQQDGMNESEAIGRIIASIGSVTELKKELGIEEGANDKATSSNSDAKMDDVQPTQMDADFLQEFRNYKGQQAKIVAVAVGCFILSPCMYLLFDRTGRSELLGTILFFFTIAIGVALCIFAGRHDEYYKAIMSEPDKNYRRRDSKLAGLFAGIAFPLAVIAYLLMGFGWHLWHPGWVIFPLCGVITGAIGAWDEYRRDM